MLGSPARPRAWWDTSTLSNRSGSDAHVRVSPEEKLVHSRYVGTWILLQNFPQVSPTAEAPVRFSPVYSGPAQTSRVKSGTI